MPKPNLPAQLIGKSAEEFIIDDPYAPREREEESIEACDGAVKYSYQPHCHVATDQPSDFDMEQGAFEEIFRDISEYLCTNFEIRRFRINTDVRLWEGLKMTADDRDRFSKHIKDAYGYDLPLARFSHLERRSIGFTPTVGEIVHWIAEG